VIANFRPAQGAAGSAFQISRIILFLPLLMVLALTMFAGLVHAENQEEAAVDATQLDSVQQEWSEAVESLQGYSVSQREAAVEKAGAALDEMDERIEVLQQRTVDEWESLSAETREARMAALQELVKQREAMAEWYGGMKHSSAQAWAEVREGFVESYDILQDAWADAAEEFE